jgi:hypothetical protein
LAQAKPSKKIKTKNLKKDGQLRNGEILMFTKSYQKLKIVGN